MFIPMLDIRRIRQNPQELLDALQKRNSKIDLTEFLQKEEERRTLLSQVETSRLAAMMSPSASHRSSAKAATRSPSWMKCASWAIR